MAELKETMTEKMAELKADKTILKDKIREMRQARSQMQTNGKKQLNMHKLDMHQKMRKLFDKREAQMKVLKMQYKELHDTWQADSAQLHDTWQEKNREYYSSCNEMKQQFRKKEGMLRAEIQKLDADRDRTRQLLKAVEEKQKRLKLEQEKAKPTRKYGSARK